MFTSIGLITNQCPKAGYKVEFQTPKTIQLLGSTKKLTNKAKNEENVQSLEVVEVVLV